MKKIIVITSLLFVAVIAVAVFYFSGMQKENRDQGRLLAHIPENAVFIGAFQNDRSFFDVFEDYGPIKSLLGKNAQHQLDYLYSALLQNPAFEELLSKQRIYISFHPDKDKLEWLISIPFRKKTSAEEGARLLAQAGEDIVIHDADSTTDGLYLVDLKNLGSSVYVGFKANLAQVSFSKKLMSMAMDDAAAHLSTELMGGMQQNRLKAENDLLTLYVNQGQLFPLIDQMTKVKSGNVLNILKGFKGLSSLSMNYKSDALMFSGPSSLDSAKNTYLELFANQQAIPQELKKVLPENTATFVSFAVSDYKKFHADLKQLLQNRKQLNAMEQQFAHIRSAQKVAVDSTFIPLWGNEFGYLELSTREQLGVAKIANRAIFDTVMAQLSTAVQDSVFRMDNSNLLYYAFGDPMVDFQRPYFIVEGDYYICANSVSTLQHFRNNYRQHRLLANMAEYIDFDNMQANKANITFFLHNANAQNNLKRSFREMVYKQYTDEEAFGYQRFYGMSYQLSSYEGSFFTNAYAKYQPEGETNRQALWGVRLDGALSVPPAVLQYNDSLRFILAHKDDGQLIALDTGGKQLWKASLSGRAVGEMEQLSDHSVVLVTQEKLYRFYPDGSPLPGFPVVFGHEATYGATLIEEEDNLRIYVPAGERILAYDGEGKTLEGWQNKEISGNILFGLKTATLGDFNYVLALTDTGRVYYFNYNGKLISVVEDLTKKHFANPFGLEIVDNDPGKSRIITTDTTGMIKSFFFDNNQLRKRVGSWSASHFFDAQNIVGDSLPELVFVDQRRLYVYNNVDSTLVFDHAFNQDIQDRPQFFPTENRRNLIGLASANERLLYLFDQEGGLVKGFPINGLPHFYFGRIKNDGHRYLLCVTTDGYLSLYRF